MMADLERTQENLGEGELWIQKWADLEIQQRGGYQ